MIINKEQRDCILDNGEIGKELVISYIDKEGLVKFLQYKIPESQMFQWEYCGPKQQFRADPIYRSWDNKPVKRKKCKKLNDFRVNELLCAFGDRINPIFDSTPPITWFCDIETEISLDGFTDPETARMPINTIALTRFPKTIVWGRKELSVEEQESIQQKLDSYANGMTKGYDFEYRYFYNEADMLLDFLKFIKDIPALTGWNFVGYDWLYIINRCKLLNINYNFISPTGQFSRWKLNNKSGNINCPVPLHKIIYDYMLIMKRWDYSLKPYESFRLDWVAEKALGYKKVDHPDFITFYRDFYPDYVFYNIIDTILVEHIDKKMHMADVMFSLAAEIKIEIKDTLSTITPVHTAITNFIYKQNKVFPVVDKEDTERGDYEGAFVWPSQPGVYKYVGGIDAQSMYPGIIRQFQISSENYLGQTPNNYIRKNNEIVTKSRAIFRKDKNAVLPAVCKFYFDERVAAKNCKKSAVKQYKDFAHILEKRQKNVQDIKYNPQKNAYSDIDPINCELSVLQSEIERLHQLGDYYENKQLAFKIFINSIYGACGNQYMRLFDLHCAEAITLQGQDLNHYSENCVNEYFTKVFQTDTALHKKLGISSDKAKTFDLGKGRLTNHGSMDPRDFPWLNGAAWTAVCYGDTDSVEKNSIVQLNGIEDTIENWYNKLAEYREIIQKKNGQEILPVTDTNTLTFDNGIVERPVNYLMRHKVLKPKWKIRTKSGKEIIVTGDHSIMVMRDNELISIKAKDINKKTDKIISVFVNH